MKKTLIIIFILTLSLIAKESIEKAYLAKAEKLELKKGKIYIIPTTDKYYFELSITENGYSIGEAKKDKGFIWGVTKIKDNIDISTTKYENAKEISLMDKDGDGLPDYRLTIVKDKNGKLTKVIKEKVTHTFTEEK